MEDLAETEILCSTLGCDRKLPERPQMHGGRAAAEARQLYQPFRDSSNEIRLVRLVDGANKDLIECELLTVPLIASLPLNGVPESTAEDSGHADQAKPRNDVNGSTLPKHTEIPWQALSYTWGDLAHSRTILINDISVSIGRNLFEALVWYRINAVNTAIWIDALCINQEDILERGAQVGQMHRIFSLAANVVVFIPTKIGRVGRDSLVPKCAVTSVNLPDAEDIQTLKHDMEVWAKGEEESLALDTLSQLLRNQDKSTSYWRRLWTFQECVVAKSILVLAGPLNLSWARLHATINQIPEVLKQVGGDFPDAPPWTQKILGLLCPGANQRDRMRSWTGELTNLLVVTTHEVSSEPRDSVYAMLGLLKHSSIVVDYTICVPCFAQRVTQGIIRDTKRLDFLGIAPSAEECPSWVPDLVHVPFTSYHMREYSLMYESEPRFDIGPRQETLHAQGFALGQLGSDSYKHPKDPDSVSPTEEECLALVARVKEVIERTVLEPDARKSCYRDLARLTIDLDPMSTMWYQREVEDLVTGDGDIERTNDTIRAAFRTGFDKLRDYRIAVCKSATEEAYLFCHDLEDAEEGDLICQVFGCQYPLLVRRQNHGDRLLGRCFVGGLGLSQEIAGQREINLNVQTFRFM